MLGKPYQRKPGGTFWIRGTVCGQSVYESAKTRDPRQAEAYRAKREKELWDRAIHGARAVVTFAEAAGDYLEASPRSPKTCDYVAALILHFGPKKLISQIEQTDVDAAYKAILEPGAANGTKLRNVLTPLLAIMNRAATRKWCDVPAFEVPEVDETETPFLRPAEATALVQAAAPHLRPLLIFLIGTGCRMSEALELEWEKVDLRGARVPVRQNKGKKGKRRVVVRQVDLPPVVVAALSALPHRDGRVFRPPVRTVNGLRVQPDGYVDNGRTGGGQISGAWATACRRAELPGRWRVWTPKGQAKEAREWVPELTPHDLRHTWASWQYAVDHDLLRLRDRGGWSTVAMVERYAHLMPDVYGAEAAAWWLGRAGLVHSSAG